MNLRNTVVVGSLFAMASGCAYLPEGYPSRIEQQSPERLFVSDIGSGDIPVAAPKVATAVEKPGLRIRKSKRGNMESYVVRGQRYYTLASSEGYSARGVASWYGPNFHGRTASNGEVYDMYRLTAAHKTLPLPTYARVTHVENGRSVVVKINDRGPFSGDRIIDLSFAAALRLGMVNDGTGNVEIQALTPDEMMVLSGPENKLDIDFYDSTEEVSTVAEAKPIVPEGVVSVAAVEVDQQPITAQPITSEPLAGNPVAVSPTVEQISTSVSSLPLIAVAKSASSEAGVVAAGSARATGELVPLDVIGSDVQSSTDASGDAPEDSVTDVSAGDALDNELQQALMPVVADANVQGVAAVPAAVQTVATDSNQNRSGYYIQAGVYADVSRAERIAVDVVLAAPGEEVHVKPLKDSLMYRITVGPIVSSDHASAVSGKLTEAGLENFTVSVK